MSDETVSKPAPPVEDESGRIRTPMSPATWTADEVPPASQTPEGEKEPERKKTTKKAAS